MLRRLVLAAPDPEASRRFHAAVLGALGAAADLVDVVPGHAASGVRLVLAAPDVAARDRALAAGRAAGGVQEAGCLRGPDGTVVEVVVDGAAPRATPAGTAGAGTGATPTTLVFATAGGLLARTPIAAPGERVPLAVREDDPPLLPLPAAEGDALLAIAVDGRAWTVAVEDVPLATAARVGVRPLPHHAPRLAALAPLRPAGGHLLLVTAAGEVKRMEAAALRGLEAGASVYDVPAGDRLVAALPHGADDHAILQSRHGKALRLDLRDIRPVKTPSAGGVAGMRLAHGDEVVAATRAAGDDLVVVHRRGNAKAVALHEYPAKGRGTGGVQSADPETPRRMPSGPINGAVGVAAGDRLLVVGAHGSLLPVRRGILVAGGRASVSGPAVRTEPGEEVVGVVALPAAAT